MEKLLIEYGVVENARGKGFGWLPLIWVNGRQHGDSYAPRGLCLEEAWTAAACDAEDEASRYIGDWDIEIKERK